MATGRNRSIVAMAVACAAMMPIEALARSEGPVAATMRRWGILGTWAADCAASPGRDNTFYTFAVREGGVFLDREGSNFTDSSPLTEARVRPDGMIEYRVVFGRGRSEVVQYNTYAKRGDGRIRIFFNRRADGTMTVEDGRLVPGGEETSWREKCAPGRSV